MAPMDEGRGARPLALWQRLEGTGATPPTVGGKAAALDRLVANGASVLRAAALTVEAYRAFVEEAGLGAWLATLKGGIEPGRFLDGPTMSPSLSQRSSFGGGRVLGARALGSISSPGGAGP
jgi:hypothetical protein